MSRGGVSVSEMHLANFRTEGSSSVPVWLHSAQSGRCGECTAVCGVPDEYCSVQIGFLMVGCFC